MTGLLACWLLGVARAEPAADGLAAVVAGDCAMCHAIPGVEPPARTSNCVACHQWVQTVAANPAARTRAMSVFPKWERYERNVRSYFAVPDLGAALDRLDPGWLRAYLRDPYDLRPAMPETMVRLGLSAAQVDAIAAWAGVRARPLPATPRADPANVARGRALFATRGCTACHAFGQEVPAAPNAAAPDLRHARDRMSDDAIAAWIQDPRAVSERATMPAMGLSAAESVAVRDYLVLAPTGGKSPIARTSPVSPVSRPVTWEEVDSRIFGKICAHCHMDPAQNEGRAGPGNAGGFGWAPTGIELQTVASVRRNEDRIVAAILRRRGEMPRDLVSAGESPQSVRRPELPGMPLGLPAIPDDDIALLLAWYQQGGPE